jgi:hypothetical protein
MLEVHSGKRNLALMGQYITPDVQGLHLQNTAGHGFDLQENLDQSCLQTNVFLAVSTLQTENQSSTESIRMNDLISKSVNQSAHRN